MNLSAGSQVEGFKIESFVGNGTIANVYKAVDVSGNTVAFKIFKDELVASKHADSYKLAVERIFENIKNCSKLNLEGIIKIHAVGYLGKYPYYVEDFVQGQTLNELVSKVKLGVKKSLEIMRDVASIMYQAHEQGMHHLNLTPSSILISNSGTIYINDFGLAKDLFINRLHVTVPDDIIGNPAYVPMEQIENHAAVGHQTDIYSIGGILYFLITARPPFIGFSAELVLQSIAKDNLARPSIYNPDVPGPVEDIIMKAMSRAPQGRYDSADQIVSDINRVLKGVKISSAAQVSLEVKKDHGKNIEVQKLLLQTNVSKQTGKPAGTFRKKVIIISAVSAVFVAIMLHYYAGNLGTQKTMIGLKEAEMRISDGDFDSAIEIYQQIINENPKNYLAYAKKADARIKKADTFVYHVISDRNRIYELALEDLKKSLEVAPADWSERSKIEISINAIKSRLKQ